MKFEIAVHEPGTVYAPTAFDGMIGREYELCPGSVGRVVGVRVSPDLWTGYLMLEVDDGTPLAEMIQGAVSQLAIDGVMP